MYITQVTCTHHRAVILFYIGLLRVKQFISSSDHSKLIVLLHSCCHVLLCGFGVRQFVEGLLRDAFILGLRYSNFDHSFQSVVNFGLVLYCWFSDNFFSNCIEYSLAGRNFLPKIVHMTFRTKMPINPSDFGSHETFINSVCSRRLRVRLLLKEPSEDWCSYRQLKYRKWKLVKMYYVLSYCRANCI